MLEQYEVFIIIIIAIIGCFIFAAVASKPTAIKQIDLNSEEGVQ